MAAPNIVNVATITGKTAVLAVTTSATAIVSNGGSSGQVLKVNSLTVANVDGTNAAEVTVDLLRGGTAYRIALSIAVPAKSSIVPISTDNRTYLEEGDSLRVSASANGDLEALCSYEVIS